MDFRESFGGFSWDGHGERKLEFCFAFHSWSNRHSAVKGYELQTGMNIRMQVSLIPVLLIREMHQSASCRMHPLQSRNQEREPARCRSRSPRPIAARRR